MTIFDDVVRVCRDTAHLVKTLDLRGKVVITLEHDDYYRLLWAFSADPKSAAEHTRVVEKPVEGLSVHGITFAPRKGERDV